MNEFTVKEGRELRLGYTTGSCAAAATKAAAYMLLTGEDISSVQLTTPSGKSISLEIVDAQRMAGSVSCAVVKDAGDDPDVTHGMRIYSTVSFCEGGICIDGGEGVGRVTKPGLPTAVGKPAINPVPLSMIERELRALLDRYPCEKGLSAVISAPQGSVVAQKTFNPRLGIEGGISILGTTGIVEPMSEKAIIKTIRLEMEMKHRQNNKALLLIPGNYGADFARTRWGLDLNQGVMCSNFIGEALDYGGYLGFGSILLVGHVGKLVKLAAGIMNTHSSVADARMEILSAHAALAGADSVQIKAIMDCATTDAALDLLDCYGITSAATKTIAEKIKQVLDYRVGERAKIYFALFRGGSRIFCSSGAEEMDTVIREIKEVGETS